MILKSSDEVRRLTDQATPGIHYWAPPDDMRPVFGTVEPLQLQRSTLQIVNATWLFHNAVQHAHHRCANIFSTGGVPHRCQPCSKRTSYPNVLTEALDPLINKYVLCCLQDKQNLETYGCNLDSLVFSLDTAFPYWSTRIDWKSLAEGAQKIAVTLGHSATDAEQRAIFFCDQYDRTVVSPYVVYLRTRQSR